MPVDINSFHTIASQKQFSRDFFMRVKQITIPGLSLNGETDLVYARTAKLPGRDIEDKTVNYGGQVFHLNGRATYPGSEGYEIEFYCDQNLDLRSKFEKASRTGFNNETSTANFCMAGPESYIELDVLGIPCGTGNAGGSSYTVLKTIKLIGANIRNVGEIAYEIADGTGEIKTFTATFSYHWYQDFAQ